MEDKYYSRLIKVFIFLMDFCFIQIVFIVVKSLGISEGISNLRYTSFILIFSLIWTIAGFANGIHRINKFSMIRSVGKNLFSTVGLHALILALVVLAVDYYRFELKFFMTVYLMTTFAIMCARAAFKLTWKYFEFSGFHQRKVIIVGATRSGKALFDFFKSHNYTRYHFKGFFDDHSSTPFVNRDLIQGKLADIETFCKQEDIQEIYFALPLRFEKTIQALSKFADDNFIYMRIVPDFSKAVTQGYNVFLFDSIPVFTPRNEPLSISLNAGIKRLFDIAFSLFVILFIFPFVVPLITLAIRLDTNGPIIFKQLRRGKKHKLFECYKFRTMQQHAAPNIQATENDPRITRVGRFLRKSNLDELPQFVNVLLGNMSVVGPRPHISIQDSYAPLIANYKFRLFVTPGITGYAQVNGFRGETKETSLMAKRVEYDIKYMENWSLSLDIKIIFQTIWLMLRGQKNAY
jgi:putative colanic acid biosysnthesis UDP-glucose lipid carrier transferase